MVANAWLEGTYSELYSARRPRRARAWTGCSGSSRSRAGSRATPRPTPPGRSTRAASSATALAHAYGAAFDNPDLLVACVVGDGEAETGAAGHRAGTPTSSSTPSATVRCCPILHLNGYKIANPTVLARIPDDELSGLFTGYGYRPLHRERRFRRRGPHARASAHGRGARRLPRRDRRDPGRGPVGGGAGAPGVAHDRSCAPPRAGRARRCVDGVPVEGTWRAHQVPLGEVRTNPAHLAQLEEWMRSYRPEELFDEDGRPGARRSRLSLPTGDRRMSANPHANGGAAAARPRAARLRRRTRSRCERPGPRRHEATRVLGGFLRDVIRRQPDATSGSSGPTRRRRTACRTSSRSPTAPGTRETVAGDDHLAPDGRVMEVLSEHLCQGWLEGYLLTGRHGLFNCYEAFIHIVDSMFNQHAKWLESSARHPVAAPGGLAQLPALEPRVAPGPQRVLPPGPGLHRPRRQQEGVGRPRLPPARRQLPVVGGRPLPAQPRLRQRDRGRQAAPARLAVMDEAIDHCTRGLGHLGLRLERRADRSPTSSWRAAGTCPPSRPWRRSTCSAAISPSCGCGSSTWSTSCGSSPTSEHPHGHDRHRVRHHLHRRTAR